VFQQRRWAGITSLESPWEALRACADAALRCAAAGRGRSRGIGLERPPGSGTRL